MGKTNCAGRHARSYFSWEVGTLLLHVLEAKRRPRLGSAASRARAVVTLGGGARDEAAGSKSDFMGRVGISANILSPPSSSKTGVKWELDHACPSPLSHADRTRRSAPLFGGSMRACMVKV
jgi:hypothetical protein